MNLAHPPKRYSRRKFDNDKGNGNDNDNDNDSHR